MVATFADTNKELKVEKKGLTEKVCIKLSHPVPALVAPESNNHNTDINSIDKFNKIYTADSGTYAGSF